VEFTVARPGAIVEELKDAPERRVCAFASRMIDRGISSTVLAALMGHESSTITERRYVHLFDRQRTDEAVQQAMASAAG
jgi:integrase